MDARDGPTTPGPLSSLDPAYPKRGQHGSLEKFKEMFQSAVVGQFGSGWGWLLMDKTELKIAKTGNAMTPIATGNKPLLTCDVWEHAYYLDYKNRRADFVKVIPGFVATNLR